MGAEKITEMTEIVVPLDGRDASVRSVPVAGRLAGRLGLGIRLCGSSEDSAEMGDRLRAIAAEYLSDRDVTIDVRGGGDPAEAIVHAAGETGLVCMATAASLMPHQGHVGSVAEDVVRSLQRPVVLVGPEMQPRPGQPTQRVIVPVDGSDRSEAALGPGADLARMMDVPLWIVEVISRKDEAMAGARLGSDVFESGYVRSLAKDVGDANGLDVEYEVLHGDDPAEAIVDFTGDDGTIVMSTHGRSGLSRVFAGSVATGVVARSARAVVTWRPETE